MISATSKAIPFPAAALWAVLALACGKPETPAAATADPAGKVEAVEGQVTAVRAADGSVARPLAVAATVFADDTVTTAPGASVAIRLNHNAALWRLEGGFAKRLDQTAAWKAPKDATPQAIAQRTDPVQTASAGRHSAHEAAGTAESAARAEPPRAVAPMAPPAPAAAAPEEPASAKVADSPAAERRMPRPAVRHATAGSVKSSGGLRGSQVELDLGFDGSAGSVKGAGIGGGNEGGANVGGSAPGGSMADAPTRTPTLTITVEVEDSALKAALLRLMTQRKAALARCVQQASKTGVAMPAKFVVRIEIGGAGAVTVVAVEGAPDPLKACARAVVASVRGLPDTSPAVEAGVVVRVQ